ncbi:MAG: hypothetical protein AAB383_02720 [Patescibacteria group bacterium]
MYTPRFQPDEIEEQLKVGDRVDWCGQPCIVRKIDKSQDKAITLENLLNKGDIFSVEFAEINDITGTAVANSALSRVIDGLRRAILG